MLVLLNKTINNVNRKQHKKNTRMLKKETTAGNQLPFVVAPFQNLLKLKNLMALKHSVIENDNKNGVSCK